MRRKQAVSTLSEHRTSPAPLGQPPTTGVPQPLAAGVVSVGGLIGFVGLIVPHVCRLLVGADHRFLLLACAIVGATLMIGADLCARLVFAPLELPVGAVLALLGAPYFLWLLRREG